MKMKVTLAMKFEMLNFLENENKMMYKIFDELKYEAWKMSNRAIQMYWDIENTEYSFKQKYNEILDLSNLGITQKKDAYIAYSLKKEYKKLNTSSVECISQHVKGQWKQHRKEVVLGNESIISYRRDRAQIKARDKQINLENIDKNEYKIGLRLLSKEYAQQLHEEGFTVKKKVEGKKKAETITYKKNNDDMWMYFKIKAHDKRQKLILDSLINKNYKIGTSAILYDKKKNKYFMSLVYSHEVAAKNELISDRIMGIDVGVNIPATLAISDDKYYREYVGTRHEIEDFRKQVESRKKRYQRAMARWAGEGRKGHGYNTRMKSLEKLSGTIANFKSTKNHAWSKYIVQEAVKNQCAVIQMEDLTGISERESFLKTWSYYDLQTKIKYKAEMEGIKVVMIKPSHTSARCNKCGHIHPKATKNQWRPTQEEFKCLVCDYKVNADLNAAKNIAMDGIEKIIEEQLAFQKKAERNAKEYVMN